VRKFSPSPTAILVAVWLALNGAGADLFAQASSDDRVKTLLAQAAATVAQPGPGGVAGTSLDLTLDDAVRLALERNLDIAVERLNPQTFDLSIAQLRAAYRPVFNSTVGQRSQATPATNQLVGGQRVVTDVLTYNAGMGQSLPWGGGNLSFTWNNNRQESSNIFTLFNPAFNSSFNATYTQPLLRGFSIDNTRQQLRVTSINRDISEIQLRATITNTVSNVRNAYWDLVFASESVEVAQRSLDLAEKLVDDNRVRVEIGTMAPIDIVQAEAEAATRRQALTQTEATRQTAELVLKRLLVEGTDDPVWRSRLNLVDRPALEAETVDVESALRTALERRTDLQQTRRQLEGTDVSLRYLRNQTLPSVDLVASYAVQGLGGTRFIREGGLGAPPTEVIPGGYADALNAIARRDFPTWNVLLNISYPIGGSAADAQYARARVQRNQNLTQLRVLELQVATEVTNAALQVQNNLKRVEAARAARELVHRRLEAEESKFEVGMSTNFFVVQAQRDLADAQNAELRALLDYRKSLVDFERAQETSLSRAGISVAATGGAGTGTTTGGAAGAGATGAGAAGIGGGGFGGGSGVPGTF
jgi:outer membrane protein